jgi:hypothetical protein
MTVRRERGSLIRPKQVNVMLESAADERLAAMATAAGATKSALVQWLIDQAQLDESGRPAGWPDQELSMTG